MDKGHAHGGAQTEQASRKVVLGTAGHVDHGKTALVRALTGVDTDRLPEEKARGISIELGFAEFKLPSGRSAAIIDVPGHERFVRNMLAGATGIDLVMLVVAADEGVMPQTREHLDIVSLLGVQNGIKVVTKVDTVDGEWLELVKEDVEALTRGTFLERAPTVATSSVSGEGLEELRVQIDSLLDRVSARDALSYPRLPVDRVFSMPGHGTVVTGTLVAGTLAVEDRVSILPAGRTARVRGLQVHGRAVESAGAGQRVAMNLSGVDRDEVGRGDVVTHPGWLEPCRQFAVRLRLLGRAPLPLKNFARVHLHYGTAEALARVVLLDGDGLEPGGQALARLRTEEPVVIARGDRFIIRSYSPVTTIGGGTVIVAPSSHKRKSKDAIADLEARERGDPESDIASLLSRPPYSLTSGELARQTGLAAPAVSSVVETMVGRGEVIALGQGYMAQAMLESISDRIVRAAEGFFRDRPLRLAVGKAELRRLGKTGLDTKAFGSVLNHMSARGALDIQGDKVRVVGVVRESDGRLEAARQEAVARLSTNPFSPPSPDELTKGLGLSAGEEADLLSNLCDSGDAVRIAESVIVAQDALCVARQRLVERLEQYGSITVSEYRDMLSTSRKYALPLLEYFDQMKLTKRRGDERVPFFSR